MIKKDAIIMIMDDTNSPMLSAFCGLPPSFTFTKNVPRNDMTMPTPASTRGSSTAERPLKLSENPGTINAAPSTIVPMMDPTYDSNRSAPMPATSPTLSPTYLQWWPGSMDGLQGCRLPLFLQGQHQRQQLLCRYRHQRGQR